MSFAGRPSNIDKNEYRQRITVDSGGKKESVDVCGLCGILLLQGTECVPVCLNNDCRKCVFNM